MGSTLIENRKLNNWITQFIKWNAPHVYPKLVIYAVDN